MRIQEFIIGDCKVYNIAGQKKDQMQFLPQQNEFIDTLKPTGGYDSTLSLINNRLSPMLPLHFDKSFLPKDLCELEYLKLAQCKILRNIDHSNRCSYDVTKFERCRKNRDIRILDGIKRWQTEHINSLPSSDRKMYLQGLTFKMDRLKDDYSKVPSTVSKQIKLLQIESQLETIKWRINYIKKLI